MRRLLLVTVLVSLILIQSAYALILEGDEPIEPITPKITPIINKGAPLDDTPLFVKNMTVVPIKQEFLLKDGNILNTFLKIIGVEIEVENVTVKYGDQVLAILPPETKFENLQVHDYCLNRYQFGTEDFYSCEVE